MAGTITLEGLKAQPISVGLFLVMIAAVWPSVAWFNDYHADFISRAAASQAIQGHIAHLEQKVDRNTRTVDSFQAEVRIRMALQRVEALEARLYVLNRDQADSELIHEVENSLTHARNYCDCLVNNRPNCQHLEPGRSR